MTNEQHTSITPSLLTRMLIGGGIALALIALFLSGINDPDPAWPEYWKVRPFLIVPLAGAGAGLCSFYLQYLLGTEGWRKGAVIALTIIGYLIALWLGFVLGLDGTLWN